MNDHPKDDGDPNTKETPMQRAMRMRKAALQAKPKTPDGAFNREQSARMPSGASKPWMKR